MTPETCRKLKELLIDDEQYKQFAYTDTTGHLTIGIGRNLTNRGLSFSESKLLLEDDITYFNVKLLEFVPVFIKLDDNRKMVLINMCFNVGINGFLEFKDLLSAIERGNYIDASLAILDSKAARQDPRRYERLAEIMKTGEFDGV